MEVNRNLPPPGQRSEVTSPTIAIAGAAVIVALGILVFSFWPESSSLKTDGIGKASPEEGAVTQKNAQ